MNHIHIKSEYVPFEEFYSHLYIKNQARRMVPDGNTEEENNVAIIISLYSSVLALALWQASAAEA